MAKRHLKEVEGELLIMETSERLSLNRKLYGALF